VELIEFGRLSDEARADVEGDEPDPFGAAGNTLTYRAKDRHVALRGDDGHLVASTGMLELDVEVSGERFAVVGIGGVIVNARHRGRGLAREVVEAALARARTLGPRLALLFCHEDRAGLYEGLGFAYVTAAVTVEQPGGGGAAIGQRSMWRALAPGATWPDGPVSVLSLPF
jgi:GNAT superfamily N-acetyltransferase